MCVVNSDGESRGEGPNEAGVWLLSVPEEMKVVGEEERKRMKRRWRSGFVCISVQEMESFYRYSLSCQKLHSEFLRE